MPNYRNRRLLDLAHEMPCCADFPHECNSYDGVVPCHSNEQSFGRGASYRTHDWAYAACCSNAHAFIDGVRGGWKKEDKHAEWLRAFVKTQTYLWTHGKVRVA